MFGLKRGAHAAKTQTTERHMDMFDLGSSPQAALVGLLYCELVQDQSYEATLAFTKHMMQYR